MAAKTLKLSAAIILPTCFRWYLSTLIYRLDERVSLLCLTDLTKPAVNVRHIGSIIAIAWPPVTGASTYKVQSYDDDRTILQEVSYYTVESEQTFFQPYTNSQRYTVIVTAETDDHINSSSTVDIEPQTTTSGTTSTAITLPIETQPQNTTIPIQTSTNDDAVTTQTTTTTATTTPTPSPSTSRLTTILSEDGLLDERSFKTRPPKASSRDDKGIRICHSWRMGVAALHAAFASSTARLTTINLISSFIYSVSMTLVPIFPRSVFTLNYYGSIESQEGVSKAPRLHLMFWCSFELTPRFEKWQNRVVNPGNTPPKVLSNEYEIMLLTSRQTRSTDCLIIC